MRALTWFHRWLGVATCVVFAMWFASGAVLLFKPFPFFPHDAQLAVEPAIDLASIRISPATAWAVGGGGDGGEDLRLVQRGDVPAYILTDSNKTVAMDAQTGQLLPPLQPAEATAIGRRAVGAGVAGPAFHYDQWVVHNRFDPWRPFYRLDVPDKAGTQYYLSASTGEILQRTERAERGWNWVGAVLHWVYLTPLRSSFTAWDRTVWMLSFTAMLVAVAGIIVGLTRMLAARRQRNRRWTFFRLRWMRWHHLLGLVAGWFLLAWVFSGWLSMDHDRIFFDGRMTSEQQLRYAGISYPAALQTIDIGRIPHNMAFREIRFSVAGGSAIVSAWDAGGQVRAYRGDGSAANAADIVGIARRGLEAAWGSGEGADAGMVAANDLFLLTEGWPATAALISGHGNRPDIYIDSATGRVLTVMNASRKTRAWLYYGLHTYKYPGLVDHPDLRRAIMLVPLSLGFLFAITGVVIGIKRLRKSI